LSVLAAFFGALWMGWTFRARNSLEFDLDLIWFRIPNVEIWWLLLLAIGGGALVAALIVGFAWLRARLMIRQYRSMIHRLEKEVHQLRSLPLIGSEPNGGDLASELAAEIPSAAAERG
ncbi:MAG: LapA family protein, partial [Myxococcota bacterium]